MARRPRGRAGHRQDHRVAGGRGHRQGGRAVSAAGLAHQSSALLGCPDPGGVLRKLWNGAGTGRGPAGAAPRDRRLHPQGSVAAGRGGCVHRHHLSVVRRTGSPRDRHDGHLRRLVLVLPAGTPTLPTRRLPTIPPGPTTGCPSTSTSVVWSTRSSTSSTPDSSSRCSTTRACWLPTSRSPGCSPRG